MKPFTAKDPIRLLLADVDGTLVTPGENSDCRGSSCCRDLNRSRYSLCDNKRPASPGMQTLIQDLRITTVVAGFNGGVSRRQNWIRSSCGDIPSDATGRTIEILKAGGLVPWLYTDTTCYVPDTKGPHVDRESKTVGVRAGAFG
jgi:hydroxymethylpyrimidine pyrophosphatase-like HAD family hydrolase